MAANEFNSGNIETHIDRGLETDPIRNFKYVVHMPINGIKFNLGFTSVSGLTATTESIPYREGGFNTTPRQVPGQTTFSPITFQHGVFMGDDLLWGWFGRLFAVSAGAAPSMARASGENAEARSFRVKKVRVQVLDHPTPRSEKGILSPFRFEIYNCWPTSISYSDLNAGDNAFLVQQMTLIHEGFTIGTSAASEILG